MKNPLHSKSLTSQRPSNRTLDEFYSRTKALLHNCLDNRKLHFLPQRELFKSVGMLTGSALLLWSSHSYFQKHLAHRTPEYEALRDGKPELYVHIGDISGAIYSFEAENFTDSLSKNGDVQYVFSPIDTPLGMRDVSIAASSISAIAMNHEPGFPIALTHLMSAETQVHTISLGPPMIDTSNRTPIEQIIRQCIESFISTE